MTKNPFKREASPIVATFKREASPIVAIKIQINNFNLNVWRKKLREVSRVLLRIF